MASRKFNALAARVRQIEGIFQPDVAAGLPDSDDLASQSSSARADEGLPSLQLPAHERVLLAGHRAHRSLQALLGSHAHSLGSATKAAFPSLPTDLASSLRRLRRRRNQICHGLASATCDEATFFESLAAAVDALPRVTVEHFVLCDQSDAETSADESVSELADENVSELVLVPADENVSELADEIVSELVAVPADENVSELVSVPADENVSDPADENAFPVAGELADCFLAASRSLLENLRAGAAAAQAILDTGTEHDRLEYESSVSGDPCDPFDTIGAIDTSEGYLLRMLELHRNRFDEVHRLARLEYESLCEYLHDNFEVIVDWEWFKTFLDGDLNWPCQD